MALPIEKAKSLKWQDPSKFQVYIIPTGGKATEYIDKIQPEDITAAIQGIQLAEINTTPVEEWVAEEWRFATGRLEHYQISLTFKDYGNFELYKMWANAIQKFVRVYPEDQRFNILVMTASDYDITSFEPTLMFMDCILVSVSGPNLDNSAIASIAEFTVTAKGTYISSF